MADALILVGHGSTKTDRSAAATFSLCRALERRSRFSRVSPAFFLHPPAVDTVLAEQDDDRIFIVPVLTSDGYFSRQELPKRCGLSGPVTVRDGREIHLCDPVGTHPRIPDLVAGQAARVLAASGAVPAETEALIVGHGTDRSSASAQRTQQIRHHVAATLGISAHHALLETEPNLDAWEPEKGKTTLIVLPYLMAHGLHAGFDIPRTLGLDPQAPEIVALNDGAEWAGPTQARGQQVWYARPIGLDAAIPELVEDRAREAALLSPTRQSG